MIEHTIGNDMIIAFGSAMLGVIIGYFWGIISK